MKRSVYWVAAAFAQGALLFALAPATPCCEMKVVSAQDDPARLTITIKNVDRPSVDVGVALPELNFEVRVASISGQEPSRTAFGKRVLAGEVLSSHGSVELGAGEAFTQNLSISQLFELKPGVYNVVLTRGVLVDNNVVRLAAAVRIRIP